MNFKRIFKNYIPNCIFAFLLIIHSLKSSLLKTLKYRRNKIGDCVPCPTGYVYNASSGVCDGTY